MPIAAPRRWKALHRFGPPVLVTLGVLWLLQGALARTSSHGVIIRHLSYNAGAVKPGTYIHDTVHLINLSARTISVDALPACGCTVADIPFQPLAPFQSEDISFEVDTTGMAVGQQKKSVLMHLNSGSTDWQAVAVITFYLQ